MKSTITFLVLFIATIVNAQWVTDTNLNTLVATSVSDDMQSIGTSDGKTIVVFWKVVGSPVNYELRMQKINFDGTQAFGADGVLVSNTIPMSTSTAIWSINIDLNDNIYIGVTGTTDQSGHAFKVDSNGNNLWGNTGIDLGQGNIVTIQPLSNGETAVSWFGTSNKAYLQKYSSSGTPIWANNRTIVSGTDNTVPANLFGHSNGDITVVFHTYNVGINSLLWAQRYSTAGDPLWTLPTQLSNTTTAFNRSYSAVQDGDVVYFGYYGSSGSRFDSYLQRINADGTLPWGINGKDFDTNQTSYELDTKIAISPGSQYVWAIANYSNVNQNLFGEYVQKFDKNTGARLFTETAKELFPISNSVIIHVGREFFLIQDSPLFLYKSGADNGATSTKLGLVYINTSGNFVWAGSTISLATFAANKKRHQFNKPTGGQAVITFIENKGSGSKIYTQNLTNPILEINNLPNSTHTISYTNPITNVMDIKSPLKINTVVVFDNNGKTLFTQNNIKSENFSLDTENWSQGIYFVKITSENALENTLKVIKK